MIFARITVHPLKISKPMQSMPAANTPNQRFDPPALASARRLLCCGFLLAAGAGLLPGVAEAEVRNSLTIQLLDNVFEIRASNPYGDKPLIHRFAIFDLDASVLAPVFIRPWRDRPSLSVSATFSLDPSDGEQLDAPRLATFDERFDQPPLRLNPSDQVRVHPRPNPTQPIPEPHAAFLFAAGIGIIASTTRRRR